MRYNSATINTSELIVWDCWERHAKERPEQEAIIHWDALDRPFRWTYRALLDASLNVADNLIEAGVKKGDICALIIRHNKFFYPIYMGITAIGAIPAVLAYPNTRLHPDKFVFGLTGIAQKSGLDWMITERELEQIIKPLIININERALARKVLFPLEWFANNQSKELNSEKIKEKQNAVNQSMHFLLQFSSGTTGLQKGVVLSHKAILEHVKRYAEAIKMTPEDKVISWLPFYHDMGLIAALHMPLAYGIPTIQIDPFQWVSAPIILFQAMSEEKATLTWLPNFAYNFMSDRINEEDMEGISLASMRMFINCSEVVRAESHEKFLGRFGKYGVKSSSLSICYAMAETTYAVTQTEPGTLVSALSLDRDSLARRAVKLSMDSGSGKVCLSSGKPISGCALKVIDKEGNELSEGQIGEIAIKSISLFEGYRNNQKATKEKIRDGWYLSGDLGFCHKGEYYILGREDDVIIVAGNNIYPEDIEDAVSRVKGVIPGRVVAFGIDDLGAGTQKVCVIAETSSNTEEEKDSLRLEIMQAGMAIDVTISLVNLVPPRWLIKSSSGKLSRKANRERFFKSSEITEKANI